VAQQVGQSRVPLSQWLNLCGDEARPYARRVHIRLCLEWGYHVLDEAANVASDICAMSKHLSKSPVGMLGVGVSGRLSWSETPLEMEVVQYPLDTDTHSWSMRRSKANWFRVMGCLSRVPQR
jgi:hypothetical protein